MKPFAIRIPAFAMLNFWILSKVIRFFSIFNRNNASANERNTETNAIFFCAGVINGSIIWK